MNLYIRIRYKPKRYSDPNHWIISFELNFKYHREKAPSWLNSDGNWNWRIQGKFPKNGIDFDWNKE